MSSSHRWEIKIAKYHSKLSVNAGRKSTVLFHMCSKNKVSKLGKGEKLNEEHDGECSKIRQALKTKCFDLFSNKPTYLLQKYVSIYLILILTYFRIGDIF